MKLKKEGEWKREKWGGGNRNWYNKDLALRPAYSKCLLCDFKTVDLRSVIRCMGMKEKDNPYKQTPGGFFFLPTMTMGLRDPQLSQLHGNISMLSFCMWACMIPS